jgi:alkylmercury lyase-like protein
VSANLDNRVRLTIYERFVEEEKPPGVADVAEALEAPVDQVEAAFRRLADARVIVLVPGTVEIWMAAPFSAVPTAFRVETQGRSYWGNCIWDGLGVVAMLGGDGTVETRCGDCEEPMALRVQSSQLADRDGVAHFAVPPAQWWDNIGFT